MKKYIKGAFVAAVAVFFLVVAPAPASANIQWNTDTQRDCPTVMMGNKSTGENIEPVDDVVNPCWHRSNTVKASPGDHINVRIFYHNTGNSPAPNTGVRIVASTGASTVHSFTGYISSSGVTVSGGGTVVLPSAQTLTLNQVMWFPNNSKSGLATPNPQSILSPAGININTINPGGNYSGSVIASFIVGNANPNPTPTACSISAFRVNPTSVNVGQSSYVVWNTQGCASVSVTGPGVNGSGAYGSVQTPALNSNTTYNISARSSSGVVTNQSATVTVNGVTPTACSIGTFRVNPTNISAGQTSNVIWNTTGCTSVTVSGNGVSDSQLSGSRPTPALYGTTTYTITARSSSGQTQNQSATVYVTNTPTPATCAINSFYAVTPNVNSGSPATLSWNTSGCSSVSISGISIPTTQFSGTTTTQPLYGTTTFTLTAYGQNGQQVNRQATVSVNSVQPSACVINSFTGPGSVTSGSSATLNWSTSNCTNVSMTNVSIPSNQLSGSVQTSALYNTTNYMLTAYGANGASVNSTVTVNVNQAQNCVINSFSGPSQVQYGSSATLSWVTNGCSYVTISGPGLSTSGNLNANSSTTTNQLYNNTNYYTLTAYSTNGNQVTQNFTVTTNNYQQNNCMISSFYANPSSVQQGNSTTLLWNTYGCNNVSISGAYLPSYSYQSLSGSVTTGALYNNSSYTLTAYGSYGSPVSQTITVNVDNNQYQSTPSVTTNQATNVVDMAATLNGYVSSYGSLSYYNNYATYYFQYGTSQYAMNSQTPSQSLGAYAGSVSTYVSNLLPNTTYYFRAVAQNNYGTNYGSTLSFVTGNNNTNTNANVVTSIATNVTTSSARFNGIILAPASYGTVNGYFEYGRTLDLGSSTTVQPVTTNTLMNFFDTVTVSPNTVYYFRAAAVIGGITYRGATVSFTTPAVGTGGPNIVVTNNTTGTGGNPNMMLTITSQFQNIFPGDTINYTVNYRNISGRILSNATLNVMLPAGVTFRQASMGVLTTSNTVAAILGTIPVNGEGTMTIQAIADRVNRGDTLIATATLAFALPNGAQDAAVAYAMNTVSNSNSTLAGLALFGGGFFPTTLLGWLLLIALIILLIILARRAYERRPVVVAPTSHTTMHPHVDNLPH